MSFYRWNTVPGKGEPPEGAPRQILDSKMEKELEIY